MKISRTAVKRLQNIPWFTNTGKGGYLNNIKKITAESDFISRITSDDWENVSLQAGNAITGYLAIKQSLKYQYWNLVSFLAEDAYKSYLPNSQFFGRLMMIYEN